MGMDQRPSDPVLPLRQDLLPPPPLSGPSSPGALPCQCPDVLFQKTKSPFTKEASECLLTFPFLNPSNAGEILVLVKDVLAHKSNAVSGGSADLQ